MSPRNRAISLYKLELLNHREVLHKKFKLHFFAAKNIKKHILRAPPRRHLAPNNKFKAKFRLNGIL